MKILLISDTHGDISKVMKILERIKDIDMILHCGDYQSDAWTLEDSTGIPVTSVAGNCDSRLPDRKVVETPAGKILMTHGHMEGAGWTYNNLVFAADEEQDCVAVCFGHTHIPLCEDVGGLWLVNPGSLTEPRGGSRPSYAVLRCEDDMFHATLADYDTLMQTSVPSPDDGGGSSESGSNNSSDNSSGSDPGDPGNAAQGPARKKKATGGFLRNLLNYSDRF